MKWPTWLPRPSFWTGCGSVLDLFGTQRIRPEDLKPWTEGGLAPTDEEELASDWRAVADDMETAFNLLHRDKERQP